MTSMNGGDLLLLHYICTRPRTVKANDEICVGDTFQPMDDDDDEIKSKGSNA